MRHALAPNKTTMNHCLAERDNHSRRGRRWLQHITQQPSRPAHDNTTTGEEDEEGWVLCACE